MRKVTNNIKKCKLGILFSIFIFLFLNCTQSNNPEGITKKYLKHLNELDFESAKEISTDEGIWILQLISNYYDKLSDQEIENQRTQFEISEIEIISVKEEGDSAIVEYKTDGASTKKMELKKVDDKWKVNYKKPILQKIPMDLSQVYTSANVYGQSDTSYSKQGYPFVEYFFDGAWLDYKIANFFMKNVGSEGTCDVIISDSNDKQTFSIKANTSYVLRIKPWGFGNYKDDFISIKMDQLIFKSTKKPKRGYELIFEEIYSKGDTDLSDPQDREWFNDTIWNKKAKYCMKVKTYIKLRKDGLLGSKSAQVYKAKPENFKFNRKSTWKIEDGFLVFDWNKGFATSKYRLSNKNTNYLVGTYKRSDRTYGESYVIHRINK